MKKIKLVPAAVCVLFAFSFLLPACIKDECKKQHTYTYYVPLYKTKDEVRANIKTNAVRKIENPGKIYVLGSTIFLNEIDKGIHIIDNSNPANPQITGFIDIPGNLDIAAKGTTLYADLYTDLVTLDITNPADVKVKKITDNIFPARYWGGNFVAGNSNQMVVEWLEKDTTVTESCESSFGFRRFLDAGSVFFSATAQSANTSASPIGTGGSMARFTIMNNRLYTVNHSNLDVFNITTATNPVHSNSIQTGGWNIETIYPFKNKLFIGSQTGMFIYNVINPDAPTAAGQFQHVRSCDPVIADDNYAYVTLRSGNVCNGFTNQLEVVKLNNFTNPTLEKTYPMTNPHGLSKDGNTLMICDGSAGLKIYNASNVMSLSPIKTIDMHAYDVIAGGNMALVVAKDGLYQYDYSNLSNIRLLSKIAVVKN